MQEKQRPRMRALSLRRRLRSRAGPAQRNPPRGLHIDSVCDSIARMVKNTAIPNIKLTGSRMDYAADTSSKDPPRSDVSTFEVIGFDLFLVASNAVTAAMERPKDRKPKNAIPTATCHRGASSWRYARRARTMQKKKAGHTTR